MNKRRRFLACLTTTALLPLLPVRRPIAAPQTDPENAELIRILLELLPDNPASYRLGVKALRHYRHIGNAGDFPDRLLGSAARTPVRTADQMRRHLRSLCDADFATGDTVTLDGWIMARSEAEAIALVCRYRPG